MNHTINLEPEEIEVVEKLIENLKLPLEFILGPDEAVEFDSDYFYNTDTDENIPLEEGFKAIVENANFREIFNRDFSESDQKSFLSCAVELGVSKQYFVNGKSIIDRLPANQRKIQIPVESALNRKNLYITAELYSTCKDHAQLSVYIEDDKGNILQDIALVEPAVAENGFQENTTIHDKDFVRVAVWTDETSEDYTFDFKIEFADFSDWS